MAIGNRELMHECFPKHWSMGTARMKYDKKTDKKGKKRDVSMERSKVGTKKEVPPAYHILTKYNNNKHNIVAFHKIWKKYDEVQLIKNKMVLNIQKTINHPPSPQGPMARLPL